MGPNAPSDISSQSDRQNCPARRGFCTDLTIIFISKAVLVVFVPSLRTPKYKDETNNIPSIHILALCSHVATLHPGYTPVHNPKCPDYRTTSLMVGSFLGLLANSSGWRRDGLPKDRKWFRGLDGLVLRWGHLPSLCKDATRDWIWKLARSVSPDTVP